MFDLPIIKGGEPKIRVSHFDCFGGVLFEAGNIEAFVSSETQTVTDYPHDYGQPNRAQDYAQGDYQIGRRVAAIW